MNKNELRINNIVGRKYTNPNPKGATTEIEACFVKAIKEESVNISLSLKDKAILSKVRYASIEPIPLTEKWLNKLEFEKNTEYKFNSYQLHPYWAQNGVILFYNTGQEEYAYLCGYAEQRMGKYYAVGARWIKSVHELQNLYFALTGVELQLSST